MTERSVEMRRRADTHKCRKVGDLHPDGFDLGLRRVWAGRLWNPFVAHPDAGDQETMTHCLHLEGPTGKRVVFLNGARDAIAFALLMRSVVLNCDEKWPWTDTVRIVRRREDLYPRE